VVEFTTGSRGEAPGRGKSYEKINNNNNNKLFG
jgi:hypothetical protein